MNMDNLFDDPYADPELDENVRLGLALDPDTYLTKSGRYARKRQRRED
jgi:hypothetical protein